ncbi:Hypothetical_protein [Hexamita inflata]|uniref:Hypothetical_protein n=1 Tax=Hexamita inflata TaxID=28002 RepID=A0AA86PK99_9EUKA|nr:Hypothetical protein HINF_LOCUS24682 [Hexamita inflata]
MILQFVVVVSYELNRPLPSRYGNYFYQIKWSIALPYCYVINNAVSSVLATAIQRDRTLFLAFASTCEDLGHLCNQNIYRSIYYILYINGKIQYYVTLMYSNRSKAVKVHTFGL